MILLLITPVETRDFRWYCEVQRMTWTGTLWQAEDTVCATEDYASRPPAITAARRHAAERRSDYIIAPDITQPVEVP